MKIGYARVSTKDQSLNLQKDALEKTGCEKIYSEQISGTKTDRTKLNEMIKQIRLGRSLRDLVNLISKFQDLGVGFKSLQDSIDTTTPTGKLTFHLFAALAEFERDIISERTKAGLASARARGRRGGRPKGLSKKALDKARLAESLYNEKNNSIQEICEYLSISKPTLYRYLRSRGATVGSN